MRIGLLTLCPLTKCPNKSSECTILMVRSMRKEYNKQMYMYAGVSLSFCAGGQWGFQLGIFSFSYERK